MTTSSPRSQGWLRDLAALFRSPAPRRPRRRMALESLEGRVMLASDSAHVAGFDTVGNLYVYGDIEGTADLDPGPQTYSVAGPTQYLAKYTPQKELLWARRLNDLFPEADAKIKDVAISSANNQDFVYVQEGHAFGEGGGGATAFSIARFQDTGTDLNSQWRTQSGKYGDIAVGGDGAVYMSYMFNGQVDFDPSDSADLTPGTGDTIASDGQDAYLAKWDVNGAFQWVRQLGGTQNEWMYDLAVVNNGTGETIYVGGIFNGTFIPQGYSGPTLTDQGSTNISGDQDGYLVGYDSAGNFISVGQFVDAWVRQVSGDASGTYIAGTHYHAALGLPGTQNDDIYFGKLEASGQALAWVKGLPGQTSNTVRDLIVSNGSLILTGNVWFPFGGAMDFDPGTATYNLTPAGGGDAYVASYGVAAGALQWARLMGSSTGGGTGEAGTSLVATGTDLYVGGYFLQGLGTFGSDVLANYSGQDGFVTRMNRTNGNHQWAFSVATAVPVVWTIDDGDIGYSEIGSGWKNNVKGGFGNDARYHVKGSGSNKAQWAFIGQPTGSFEVLVTWKADSKNASNAAYKVSGTTVTTVTKSQTIAPNDYLLDNSWWESLGTFVVGTDGKLTVTLSDQSNGNVVADAIRIRMTAPASPTSGSSGAVTISTDLRTAWLTEQSLATIVRTGLARRQPPIASARSSQTEVRIGELPGNQAGASATSVEFGAGSIFTARKDRRQSIRSFT